MISAASQISGQAHGWDDRSERITEFAEDKLNQRTLGSIMAMFGKSFYAAGSSGIKGGLLEVDFSGPFEWSARDVDNFVDTLNTRFPSTSIGFNQQAATDSIEIN